MNDKKLFRATSPGRMYLRVITLMLWIGLSILIVQQEQQGEMIEEVMASSARVSEQVETVQSTLDEQDELIGTFKATAYCAGFGDGCPICGTNGTTYCGTKCSPVGSEWVTIAVDPRVIDYGTRLRIVYPDGSVIYGLAEDTGGFAGDSVNPVWQIDVCYANHDEAVDAGVREVEVYEVNK